MAQVHVVANQKGVVGKTTLTVNLGAVVADALGGDSGHPSVLVVSTDPQASTVWWADKIGDAAPFDFAQAADDPRQLTRLRTLTQYRHIFVDTPGSLEDERILQAALDNADDVIVPIEPEPLGFDPTARTITKVIEPRELRYYVVVNNWDPRDGEVDLLDTREYISRRGWPSTHVVVRHYKVHTRASVEGKVVTQYPKNRVSLEARLDFQRLATELGYGGGQ